MRKPRAWGMIYCGLNSYTILSKEKEALLVV
jgi:hypothetical protein